MRWFGPRWADLRAASWVNSIESRPRETARIPRWEARSSRASEGDHEAPTMPTRRRIHQRVCRTRAVRGRRTTSPSSHEVGRARRSGAPRPPNVRASRGRRKIPCLPRRSDSRCLQATTISVAAAKCRQRHQTRKFTSPRTSASPNAEAQRRGPLARVRWSVELGSIMLIQPIVSPESR